MIHSNKFRSYYSLYMMRDGNFIVYGDGKGGVGTRTTNFSSRKVDLLHTGMMWGLDHLRFIAQHPPWCHR